MTEQPASDASAVVAADPFWSVVRRRHPDVDIVLLPDPPPAPVTDGLPTEDPDQAAARVEAEAAGLWTSLAGDLEPIASARWRSGPTPESLVREVTLHADGVDAVRGIGLVSRAADALAADGWHTLAPPDGVPRVLAGRAAGVGRREVQVLHAPATSRLVLRLRSEPVVVGRAAVRALPRSAS